MASKVLCSQHNVRCMTFLVKKSAAEKCCTYHSKGVMGRFNFCLIISYCVLDCPACKDMILESLIP